MLNKLPELLYNFSSKPLDPDFLVVKNIWRRAQVLTEFKSQVTIFTEITVGDGCLLYTSPSPRDRTRSRMPSSA